MYLIKVKKSLIREYAMFILLGLMFVFSGLMYFINNYQDHRVIFYFPDSVSDRLVAEYRILPREKQKLDRMSQYIEEFILGPANIRSRNVFDRSTVIRSLFYQDRNELVVDLSSTAVVASDNSSDDTRRALGILEKGLYLNFPGLARVVYLIDGNEPFIPPYVMNDG